MTPSHFRLPNDVHAAAIGDDLVLLDLRHDAYFCVPGAVPFATEGALNLDLLSSEHAAELQGAGLLATAASASPQPLRPPRPSQDLEDPLIPRLALRDLADLALMVWDSLAHYRGASLRQLIGPPAAARSRCDVALSDDLARQVARYRRLALWAPLPRKCLLQCFLLRRYLRRRGHDAAWVFAVRTWPFGAHCWLQVGEVVLDDRYERLAAYEPILIA